MPMKYSNQTEHHERIAVHVSFHLNHGHTVGFHPEYDKMKPQRVHCKVRPERGEEKKGEESQGKKRKRKENN